MTKNDSHLEHRPEAEPETGARGDLQKAVWERPDFQRIGADQAETGILFGPEILILLS